MEEAVQIKNMNSQTQFVEAASWTEVTEKWAKYQPFYVMNTTHPFVHFRFTDFHETWQQYVNPCAVESCCSEILKNFR